MNKDKDIVWSLQKSWSANTVVDCYCFHCSLPSIFIHRPVSCMSSSSPLEVNVQPPTPTLVMPGLFMWSFETSEIWLEVTCTLPTETSRTILVSAVALFHGLSQIEVSLLNTKDTQQNCCGATNTGTMSRKSVPWKLNNTMYVHCYSSEMITFKLLILCESTITPGSPSPPMACSVFPYKQVYPLRFPPALALRLSLASGIHAEVVEAEAWGVLLRLGLPSLSRSGHEKKCSR